MAKIQDVRHVNIPLRPFYYIWIWILVFRCIGANTADNILHLETRDQYIEIHNNYKP